MRATDEGLIYEMLWMVGEIPAGRVVNHAGRTAPGWRLQAELLHAGGGVPGEWIRGYEMVPVGVLRNI